MEKKEVMCRNMQNREMKFEAAWIVFLILMPLGWLAFIYLFLKKLFKKIKDTT